MNSFSTFYRRVFTALCLAVPALLLFSTAYAEEATPAPPQEASASPTLLSRNPFLPVDHRSVQAPARPAPSAVNAAERDLELRAFYEFNGSFNVSIHNRQTQQSTWLSPGESKNGILLRSFEPNARMASVQFDGSTAEMRLKDPSDSPLPVIRDTPGGSPAQPPRPTGQLPSAGNGQPSPAPEGRAVPRRRIILPQAPADT